MKLLTAPMESMPCTHGQNWIYEVIALQLRKPVTGFRGRTININQPQTYDSPRAHLFGARMATHEYWPPATG